MSSAQAAINSLPTFLTYSDLLESELEASQTFQFLNMQLGLKFVNASGGGPKTYQWTSFNQGLLSTFDPTSYGATRAVPYSHPTLTNNCYWNALNAQNQRRAIVGGDNDMGIPGNQATEWQYVDINEAPNPQIIDESSCTPAQTYQGVSYPPTVDTGGNLRNSTYWIPLNATGTDAYLFNGGTVYFNGKQIVAAVFTVARGQYASTAKQGNTCVNPVLTYSAPCYFWGLRTPAPFTTIPGTHALLPTTSGNMSNASGTNALQFNQIFEVPSGVTMG